MNYDLVMTVVLVVLVVLVLLVVLVVSLALKSDLGIVDMLHLNSRVQNFVFGVD